LETILINSSKTVIQMVIKSSGSSLSFSEIISEFGPSAPTGGNQRSRLGDYRLTTDYGGVTLTGVDSGVPGSGAIKFSDLYGKRLNVVVDYYNGGDQTNANARNRYNNSTYGIVHGWKAKPSDTSDIKVHVVINKKMGVTSNGSRTNVAWRSGSWTSGTRFTVYVRGNAKIYGAGGDGGNGPNGNGNTGTNAMGFDFGPATLNLTSGCYIQKGYGGGKAGDSAYSDCDKNPSDPRNGGGGGGGGAGWYNGKGGNGGPGDGGGCDGGNGSNSSDTSGGGGGSGKSCGRCGNNSSSGEPGRSPNQGNTGGNDGNCAIALAPGVSVSQTGSGTIEGGQATGQTITTA
jgi:hypothetical protein